MKLGSKPYGFYYKTYNKKASKIPDELPKIGETEPSIKYGFIKRATFGEEVYLVGSGFYVEDHLLTKNTGRTDEVLIPIRKVKVNKCETGKNFDYTETPNA